MKERINRVRVEWWDSDVLKYVEARVKTTTKGNLKADFGGRLLVFRSLVEPCDVVELQNGKWTKVGRVTRFREIILGPGMSGSELYHEAFSQKSKEVFAKW